MLRADPSEYFIHEELLRRAERGLKSIPMSWKKKRRIDPFVLIWPSGDLISDDGERIDDVVLLELPEDKKTWELEIKLAVKRTQPYALLLVEQQPNHVLAVFESIHGTKSWWYPIKPHGFVKVLGKKPVVKNNEDKLGILLATD